MQYLDSAAEVLLCLVLITFAFEIIKSKRLASPYRIWLALAMLFIAITAAFGAVRFAGELSVVPTHNLLSQISAQYGMVLYACLLTVVLTSYNNADASLYDRRGYRDQTKIARASVGLLVVGLLISFARDVLSMQLPQLLTDVVIFLGLVLFWLQVRKKVVVSIAIISLLLVPMTAVLPVNDDIHMMLFHVLLALHFGLVRRAVFSHKYHTNSAHLADIDLQSGTNH